jgi:hypothetical protein
MDHKAVSIFAYLLGLLTSAVMAKLVIDAGLVLFVLSTIVLLLLLTLHSLFLEKQEWAMLQSRTGFMTMTTAKERLGLELSSLYLGVFLIHQNVKLDYLPGCDIIANAYIDTESFVSYSVIAVKSLLSEETLRVIARHVLASITFSAKR